MTAVIVAAVSLCCVLPAYCERDSVSSLSQASSKRVDATDFEICRIEEHLRRISRDPIARQAFYGQIERVVASVRSKQPSHLVPTVGVTWPAVIVAAPPYGAGSASSLALRSFDEPLETWLSSLSPSPPQEILPHFHRANDNIDVPDAEPASSRVVSRLFYWARKNGCPPQLALATAWQESRMSLSPPDGSSGEIGIMQILPARAQAEGVNPRRLRDPDVDMWLGTRLLARYYREEGSFSRAAMKYVAGPHVFEHHYPADVRAYIRNYSSSVQGYAQHFAEYLNF